MKICFANCMYPLTERGDQQKKIILKRSHADLHMQMCDLVKIALKIAFACVNLVILKDHKIYTCELNV